MTPRSKRLIIAVGVLALLAAYWTTVWQGMDRTALSRVPILDEAHYLKRAVEISDQGWLPTEPFTMSPLYGYLVAATGSGRTFDEYRVREGGAPRGIRWLQALLWAGTAWLLWRVGRDLFGRYWAWGAPLLWLGYGPTTIFAGQVLMEIPLVFTATLALAVSGGHIGPLSPRQRVLLCGAMIGTAVLFRGTAIVLALPVIMGLLPQCTWRIWTDWRTTAAPVLLAAALVVLPFACLNSVRIQQPAPPVLNGGVNLYIGNGPGASGFFRAFSGYDVETDPSGAAYLSAMLGRTIPDALAADRAWSAEASSAMVADPARTLGLWGRKVWLHFAGVEIPQISTIGAWRRHVPLLRGLVVPWALLAVAGLAGSVLAWRRYPVLRPWLIAALLLVAVQSLFFVVTRYRMVLVPVLTLGTVAMVRELVTRRGRELAIVIGVVAISAIVVWPWGMAGTLERFAAGGLDNEAIRWEHLASSVSSAYAMEAERNLAEAELLYRRSLALVDHQPEPWQGLARVLWARGDRSGAADMLLKGTEQVGKPQALRLDLIRILIQLKQDDKASAQLALALRESPADAELLHNLVMVQARQGQLAQAASTAEMLIAAHPDNPRGYLDLGTVQAQAGNLQAAAVAFATGLQRVPQHPELARNLERAQAQLNR